MTTDALPISQTKEDTFQTQDVLAISGGHLTSDMYTAFVPAMLPLLIEKLSLSLTLAGSLTAISQIPALLNPLVGYLADRLALRYFVIFAPAVSATLLSSLGLTNSYLTLAILMFAAGVSTAAFHAPAPAMISRISGRAIGRGMSFFMAGGELARTIGPLLVVWGISTWTLEGAWRLMFLGWGASALLYFRLRHIQARPTVTKAEATPWPELRRVAVPLTLVALLRTFGPVSISIYLPTFMDQTGASLWVAGGALAIAQGAGFLGALTSGPLSDQWGRKPVLVLTIGGGGLFLLLFLNTSGWMFFLVLILMGFLIFSAQPVLLTIVQEQFPNHGALANGFFMLLAFIAQSLAILVIGYLGDQFNLQTAFFWSAILSFVALPVVLILPNAPDQQEFELQKPDRK